MENFSESHGMNAGKEGVVVTTRIIGQGRCSVILDTRYPTTSPTAVKHMSTKLMLGELDPKRVSVEGKSESGPVMVKIERTDGAMNTHSDAEMGDGRKTSMDGSGEVMFFDEEESAKRFARAMSYAITKCGGTSSAF
jgi:hypothetical protein